MFSICEKLEQSTERISIKEYERNAPQQKGAKWHEKYIMLSKKSKNSWSLTQTESYLAQENWELLLERTKKMLT